MMKRFYSGLARVVRYRRTPGWAKHPACDMALFAIWSVEALVFFTLVKTATFDLTAMVDQGMASALMSAKGAVILAVVAAEVVLWLASTLLAAQFRHAFVLKTAR